MKKFLLFACVAMLFASCDTNCLPQQYAFSKAHELEGIMVEAADMAFYGETIMPGLSPALRTTDGTTYFVYEHFDEYFPCVVGEYNLHNLDTVRVLGRTAEAIDCNHSTYHVVDIIKVLDLKPEMNLD